MLNYIILYNIILSHRPLHVHPCLDLSYPRMRLRSPTRPCNPCAPERETKHTSAHACHQTNECMHVSKSKANENKHSSFTDLARETPSESGSPVCASVSPFVPSRETPKGSRGRHRIHGGVTQPRRTSTRVNLGVPPSRLGNDEVESPHGSCSPRFPPTRL